MDIREFSNKLAEATKSMSPEEKASLMKMFEAVSDEITKIGSGQESGPYRALRQSGPKAHMTLWFQREPPYRTE